jgi:hypothetical protein
MRRSFLIAGVLALGCGDGGSGPRPGPDTDGGRLAEEFERLADSVEAGDYSPSAEALRHAAEIVRLTGHATPVTLRIDDTDRSFLAVAEQIDYANLVCTWPSDSGRVEPDTAVVPPDSGGGGFPPDSGPPLPPDTLFPPVEPPEPPECTVEGTYSMRTLIAWEPEEMTDVVRLVAHIGSNAVAPGVPDVMTELPIGSISDSSGSTPPDSGSGSGGEPGGWPGFMGEYLVRDVGSWLAFEGNQSNALEESAGPCTQDDVTIDWAGFGCEAARLRFEFWMTVEPLRYPTFPGDSVPSSGPEGNHRISMTSTSVDGVRLSWEAWSPPPLPPDSAIAGGGTGG